MKTTMKLFFAIALLAVAGFGQTILSSTTLASAVTTTNGTTLNLTSTSTMQNQGAANQTNTCLYIDAELFGVVTVVDSTHVTVVQRGRGCGALGSAARPQLHVSGATVYFANTVTNGNFVTPAASYIGKGDQPTAQLVAGSACTATNELVLPKIYFFSNVIMDCLGGAWVQTNAPGHPVLGATVTPPVGVMTATGTIFLTDTGTNAVTGITVPHGWAPGMSITIIPGGAFTTTNATNIRIASTAVAGKALIMTWDGGKWNPSY